jgi:hypothetical protein
MQPCNGTCNIVIPERFCRGSSSTSGFPIQAFGNDAFGVGINSFFSVKLCVLCVLCGSRFGFLCLCSHATALVISSSPSVFRGSSSTSGFPIQGFGNDAFGVGINSFFSVNPVFSVSSVVQNLGFCAYAAMQRYL